MGNVLSSTLNVECGEFAGFLAELYADQVDRLAQGAVLVDVPARATAAPAGSISTIAGQEVNRMSASPDLMVP